MSSCAGEILRYRKQIGADNVFVWTDIKKKHSRYRRSVIIIVKQRQGTLILLSRQVTRSPSMSQSKKPRKLLSIS